MRKTAMRKVLRESPVPLYYQLKGILQEMIDNEVLKPGDAVPPERELCAFHGISRMTARKAIMDLVNEGVLYREQGKGTFVANPKPKYLLQLKGFTEEMEERGATVRSEILSFQMIDPTVNLKRSLKMKNAGEKVYEIKRLRIVDEKPFAIETAWLNQQKVPGLNREQLEGESLYKVLKEMYDLEPEYARQTIEPVMLNEFECKLLEMNHPALAILFRRTTYLKAGEVMEYTKCIYRADSYRYEIYLHP